MLCILLIATSTLGKNDHTVLKQCHVICFPFHLKATKNNSRRVINMPPIGKGKCITQPVHSSTWYRLVPGSASGIFYSTVGLWPTLPPSQTTIVTHYNVNPSPECRYNTWSIYRLKVLNQEFSFQSGTFCLFGFLNSIIIRVKCE